MRTGLGRPSAGQGSGAARYGAEPRSPAAARGPIPARSRAARHRPLRAAAAAMPSSRLSGATAPPARRDDVTGQSASRAHTSPAAAPSRAARLRPPGTAPLPRYPPSCAVPSRGNGEHVAEAAPRVQSRASAALVPAARPRHRAALGLRRSAARTWRCWALRVRRSRPGARLRSAAGTSAGLRFHLKQTPPPRIPRAVPEPPGDF